MEVVLAKSGSSPRSSPARNGYSFGSMDRGSQNRPSGDRLRDGHADLRAEFVGFLRSMLKFRPQFGAAD